MDLDPDQNPEIGLPDDARRRIRQIAEILGCQVGDFFGQLNLRSDLHATAELLALWSAIADEPGRAAVLRCAREVAGRAVVCRVQAV